MDYFSKIQKFQVFYELVRGLHFVLNFFYMNESVIIYLDKLIENMSIR